MKDQAIDQEIQAKGLTAPRVTPSDLKANIASIHYFTGADSVMGAYRSGGDVHSVGGTPSVDQNQSLGLLTFCVLTLKNGFTVTGESACASPENFDAEIGRKIALQNAEQKIWPLMGYELKQRLHEGSYVPQSVYEGLLPHMKRVAIEKHQLDEKIGKLSAFFGADLFKGLPARDAELLTTQLGAMREYSDLLAERLAL